MAGPSALAADSTHETPAAPPPQPKKRGRLATAARILGIALAAIVLLIVLLLAGLWVWSGSEGSLAQALRLAQRFVPLEAQQVSGSIRGGGTIGHLSYRQDGLNVEVDDAQLVWKPAALLDKTLKIERLAAGSIKVEDKRAPAPGKEPSSGPPQSIALPIKIEVDHFAVKRFEWAGPPPIDVTDIAGSYAYDGKQHKLNVDNIEVMNGRYSAKATLTDKAPIRLDAQLSGQLKTDVPGGGAQNVGVTLNATAKGPLTDLLVEATAESPVAAAEGNNLARAEIKAQLTPWAAQPLSRADAKFSDFDVGALWAAAPHTQLTGEAHVTPIAAPIGSAAGAPGGWHLSADIGNAIAGPYDKQRAPIERIEAEGDWQNGVALIDRLEAKIGGGTLRASGKWAGTPPTSKPGEPNPPASSGLDAGWRIEATLDHINPALLHTQMAALPIDGKATASGEGDAIDFDVNLRTDATGSNSGNSGNSGIAQKASTSQLTRDLRELKLRDASAKGRWADGRLSLSSLRVRTDDAQLSGALDVQPAGPGGQGKLQFSAPGLDLSLDGELRENSGAGTAKVAIDDVGKLLRWAKNLPGMPESVKQTDASGRATLTARWQGGWRDPMLDVKLDVPKLDYVPPSSADASAKTVKADSKSAAAADPTIHLRDFDASISGKLSQATFKADGRAEIGQRKIRLDLAANGGRVGGNAKPLAESAWQATVTKLDAQLVDPAIGNGPWRVLLKNDVPLKWSPTAGSGSFEAGAGKAVLSAPPGAGGASSQASIEWDPVRWSAGELTTKGRLKGLPLAWAELASGGKLAGGRVSGNMVFNGDWDVTLGKKLDIAANLYRASGDLNIVTDPQAGGASAIAAGVKDARLSVRSSGNDELNVDVSWNTDRAGKVAGRISTKLSKKDDGGWTLDTDAPLAGNLQVSLPKLGVWSQLAPPGWRIEGAIDTNIKMAGTLAKPGLVGTITADDLTLRSIVDGFEFTDGRLRAKVDGQRLVIDEFTLYGAGGKAKGGSISARGSAELADGQPQAKLSATIDHLRPSLRTDAEIAVSGDVQASLEDKQAVVTGALKVNRARIQLPEDSAPSLGNDVVVQRGGMVASGAEAASATAKPVAARGRNAPSAPKKQQPPSEPQLVKLDIKIDLGNDFQVSGLGVQTGIQGELAVAGDSLTDPRVTGTIRTVDGKYRAYGQRLNIDHGLIRFTGKPTNPTLDILAKRANMEFATVQVGVEISGTALLPSVRLWSDPDLPDSEKLSWLVLGRASASSGAEAALLQTAALALISGKDSGGGIAEKFGLDELSLGEAKGAGGSGSTTGDTAVTLGKRFSKNFYAAYERSLSGAVGTLFLFYDLSKRFTLRGATGERSALDLIYTLKYD